MSFVIQLINSIFPLMILPLATIGNSLCFLVFCRPKFQKRLTRTSSICMRLLCMNDLILLYLFIIDILLKVYMKPSTRIYFSPITCRLYKCIRYSMLDFSAYLQLGLTTDRFICCVYHTYYSRWRKRNYLYYLLAIALLCIFIKNSSFLSTSYGYYSISKNRTTVKCSVKIKAIYFTIYMAYGQSLIDVVFITCLPFCLIVYFNSRILREVLRLRTECWSTLRRLMHIPPGNPENSGTLTVNNGSALISPTTTVILKRHRARRRRLHLTFALGCISFIFIFSTAPYKVFKIVERHDKVLRDQLKNGATKTTHILLAEVIIDCFVYISCSTPFFVCFATSSMFRDELRRVLQ